MSEVITSASDAIKQGKLLSYLEQENKILIERIRLLEVALSSEREACAKVAEEYKPARKNAFDFEDAFSAANSIASLIRGRGEK